MKNTPTEDELKTGVTYTVYLGGDKTSSPVKSTILVKTKEDNTTPEYTLGDVYVDGSVDDVDIMLLDYYYAELFDDVDTVFGEGHKFWENESDPRNKAADVYADGTIDDLDIMLLDYYYAELFDDIDTVFGEGHKFWEAE